MQNLAAGLRLPPSPALRVTACISWWLKEHSNEHQVHSPVCHEMLLQAEFLVLLYGFFQAWSTKRDEQLSVQTEMPPWSLSINLAFQLFFFCFFFKWSFTLVTHTCPSIKWQEGSSVTVSYPSMYCSEFPHTIWTLPKFHECLYLVDEDRAVIATTTKKIPEEMIPVSRSEVTFTPELFIFR